MTNAAHDMKVRMRADLRDALKEGRMSEAKLIREFIAALDKAEAPPLPAGYKATELRQFGDGSAEVERLSLSATQVQAIVLSEIQDRETAAAEMTRLARVDHAEALRSAALFARRYIE